MLIIPITVALQISLSSSGQLIYCQDSLTTSG